MGLERTVVALSDADPLARAAIEQSETKHFPHRETRFMIAAKGLPQTAIVTKVFLNYAANDVVLTGPQLEFWDAWTSITDIAAQRPQLDLVKELSLGEKTERLRVITDVLRKPMNFEAVEHLALLAIPPPAPAGQRPMADVRAPAPTAYEPGAVREAAPGPAASMALVFGSREAWAGPPCRVMCPRT
jgi:hypothetical protein